MMEAWVVAGVVFVAALGAQFFVRWVGDSILAGRGLPWRILLKRAEADPYFCREYARPDASDEGDENSAPWLKRELARLREQSKPMVCTCRVPGEACSACPPERFHR